MHDQGNFTLMEECRTAVYSGSKWRQSRNTVKLNITNLLILPFYHLVLICIWF